MLKKKKNVNCVLKIILILRPEKSKSNTRKQKNEMVAPAGTGALLVALRSQGPSIRAEAR